MCAIVINTSNTPMQREIDEFTDPLESLWNNCIFRLCGIDLFERKMFNVIITSTTDQRETWLEEVDRLVDAVGPNAAPSS